MKKRINGNLVEFTFDDKLEAVVVDCDKLSPELKAYCLPFAVSHRVGDNAAIPRKDGLVVTEAMRRDAVIEMATHLQSGTTEWDMKGRTRPAPQNLAIMTLAAKLGKTYQEAEAYIANLAVAELSE